MNLAKFIFTTAIAYSIFLTPSYSHSLSNSSITSTEYKNDPSIEEVEDMFLDFMATNYPMDVGCIC